MSGKQEERKSLGLVSHEQTGVKNSSAMSEDLRDMGKVQRVTEEEFFRIKIRDEVLRSFPKKKKNKDKKIVGKVESEKKTDFWDLPIMFREDVSKVARISDRTLSRWISSGYAPRPDGYRGDRPFWKVPTIKKWFDSNFKRWTSEVLKKVER